MRGVTESNHRYPLLLGAIAAAYFMTAKLGLTLDAVNGFAAIIWPPSGIALAAVLLFGPRVWPGIALGAFAVNFSMGATSRRAPGTSRRRRRTGPPPLPTGRESTGSSRGGSTAPRTSRSPTRSAGSRPIGPRRWRGSTCARTAMRCRSSCGSRRRRGACASPRCRRASSTGTRTAVSARRWTIRGRDFATTCGSCGARPAGWGSRNGAPSRPAEIEPRRGPCARRR